MKKNINNNKDLFDHLLAAISSKRFLNKEGIGNEVPFFICPFNVSDLLEINKMVCQLENKLGSTGITVLRIDLYDLTMEILKDRNLLDKIIEQENAIEKEQLKELLQNVLDIENHLIPTIEKKLKSEHFDVLFLTGIGEVFPYIRSHNVLYNLQSKAKEMPTVMFFPGTYEFSLEKGAVLNLFGRLHDDNYYRAYNILHYEV